MKRFLFVVGALLLVGGLSLAQEGYWRPYPRVIAWENTYHNTFPRLAVDGNNLYMVYYGRETWVDNGPLWFTKSTNAGITWSDRLQIGGSSTIVFYNDFSILYEGGYVHVAFLGDTGQVSGLYVTSSSDGGTNWTTPLKLETVTGQRTSGWIPQLGARQNGAIVVVRGSTGVSNIGYYLYTNGGSWSWPIVALSNNTNSGYTLSEPYPASYGNTIYTVWHQYDGGSNNDIFYNYSTTNGSNWQSSDYPLPSSPFGARKAPSLVARSDGFYSFFESNISFIQYRIFCQKVAPSPWPSGVNLSPWTVERVTNHHFPRSCVDPTHDYLRVAWWEYDSEGIGNDSIKYDISPTGVAGSWWYWENLESDPTKKINYQVSNPDASADENPDIGAGPGLRHVVWWYQHDINSKAQIWYRKNYDDTQGPCQTTLAGECNGDPHLWWGAPDCDMVDTIGGYVVYREDASQFHPIDTIPPDPYGVMEFWDYGRGCFPQSSSYYVTVLDMAENESQPSNTVTVGGWIIGEPLFGLDLGTPVPTPNTVKRSGYYQWGPSPLMTVDYDPVKLVYRFNGLSKEANYALEAVYYQPDKKSGRRQSLLVDGVELQHAIPLLDRPATCRLRVPPETYQDGAIEVSVKRVKGPDAVLAYLSLYKAKKGGPQSSELALGPKVTGLNLAYPNPTAEGAEIRYSLQGQGKVSLAIYDVSGRLVRQLVDQEREAGSYLIRWDGKSASGQKASSGVYFIRMRAGNFEATRRLVVAR
jgi:hypothetical protein